MPADLANSDLRGGGRKGGVHCEPPALVLTADAMSVRAALGKFVAQLEDHGLGLEELGSVELVVAEALNNIVEHAYGPSGSGDIQLWWTLGHRGLHVRIADNGKPMPEGRAPLIHDSCARDYAAQVPEGGFGWFLITGLARNIVYRRERGMNVLTFRIVVGESRGAAAAIGRG